MVATFCLVSCLLAPAQSAGRSDWLLAPQLSRGQEFLYRGTFSEETLGNGVQSQHQYRLETHVLILDVAPQGADVAFLTTLKHRSSGDSTPEPKYSSVRLESARIDANGRLLSAKMGQLAVPLDGPPTIECGSFVEVPRGRIGVGKTWEAGEDGRPLRSWRLVGVESVLGLTCVKLQGVQQSDDWTRPRADHEAWRRQDTVWVAPAQGIVQKVERILERRDPGHQTPTQRSVMHYELANTAQFTGDLFDDRRLDIAEARDFGETALPWLSNPGRHTAQLDMLLGRINNYLQKRSPTPYLEAVARVKRQVEAAKRGENVVAVDEPPTLIPAATVGKPAPDFVAPDLITRESARLRKWFGKPILLVFYNPSAPKAIEQLRFAQAFAARYPQDLTVLGMALSDDGDVVRKQRDELRITFPILSGTGLRLSYDVQATPKLFVLDAQGLVRGSYLGWGMEIQESIRDELARWMTRR